MKILVDNGHGVSTAGKRSPDGRLREYKYAREIAREVVQILKLQGYDATLVTPEDADISLGQRCARINAVCDKVGKQNVCLVSIHNDASGSGDWMMAGGWSAWTSRGQTKGDALADCLYNAAKDALADYISSFDSKKAQGLYGEKQRAIRTDYSDGDADYEAGFYILSHSACPACLTENLFQDNRSDVEYLLSDEGRKAIVSLHVEGIKKYVEQYKR